MLRNGQRLLEVCVSEASSQQSAEPVECPQCKQVCRPIQKRGVNITTLCGKIRVQRWVYECGRVIIIDLGMRVKSCEVNGRVVL